MNHDNTLIPVEDDLTISRDRLSGAILNTNQEAYFAHMNEKRKRQITESRISMIESDMSSIKASLQTILEILNGGNRS